MSHTPGPWIVGAKSGNDGEAWEIASETRCVAWTSSTWDEDDGDVVTEEDDANARLVAAAPELLAVCKKLAGLLKEEAEAEVNESVTYGYYEARAAIAKAEGRGE